MTYPKVWISTPAHLIKSAEHILNSCNKCKLQQTSLTLLYYNQNKDIILNYNSQFNSILVNLNIS